MTTHITAMLLMSFSLLEGPPRPVQAGGDPLDRRLAEVSYVGEDFDDAVRDWAEQAGLNFVLDWPALEGIGIYSDTRINLSLQNVSAATALRAILNVADQRHLGATYDLQDGVVTVTSQGVLNRQMEVRTYVCAALLQSIDAERPRFRSRHHYCLFDPTWRAHHISCYDGPQSILLDAIESVVAPESWENRGGPATARMIAGNLVIRQTHSNHEQISRLLRSIATSDAPPHVNPAASEH